MKYLKIPLLILIVVSMFACNDQKKEEKKKYPTFWTWLYYNPTMNFDSVCIAVKNTGIEGLMLNASTPDDYRKAIPIAHKHGLEVYAWLWTMNLEHDRERLVKEHPEWFSVNREGKSLAEDKAYVDYYKFMCPALPEVREYIKNKIKAYCEVEGLNGISIDYHRFVDVILPTTLWPKYGIVQDREYPQWDYGYHPAMIKLFKSQYGYDPREQEDPSTDEKWLQFRCDQITEVANEIAEVVHSYGKVMAASPFPTPAMSRKMVRQDWGKWDLDIVFPMVYHNFYTGDVSFISDCTIENVRDKNDKTTLFCGIMITDGEEIFDGMDEALNNGAEGIAIFTINSLRSPEIRARFKSYTDSVRAQRATGQPNPAATGRTMVNSNPFENKGIMDAVHTRMVAYLSLANAAKLPEMKKIGWNTVEPMVITAMQVNTAREYLNNLGMTNDLDKSFVALAKAISDQFEKDYKTISLDLTDYTLKDEYGATKHYKVTDRNSGLEFDVTFYFYGGIISGWNVEPDKGAYERYRRGR